MFAADRGHEFQHMGGRRYVELCGQTPVPVVVTEAEDGEYYGWLHSDREEPSMIWRGRARFTMCFPYGMTENASSAGSTRKTGARKKTTRSAARG